MKKTFGVLWLLAATLAASAQQIRVDAPNLVDGDEEFNVTFIIESEAAPKYFEWSQGEDFQLLWGPQKGSSTSTSISVVNGKRTKSTRHTLTYTYLLAPKKAGTFRLPAATAMVGGEEWTSPVLTVEVVGSGAVRSGSSRNGSSGSGASSDSGSAARSSGEETVAAGEVPTDDLFLRLSLSKRQAVVGEPITATLKLYQSVNVAGFENARFPDFNGFWSQETYSPTNIEFRRERLGDRIYNCAVLRRYTLIPQQVGHLEISPAELVCLVSVRTPSRRSQSIFDSFFDDGYRTIRKRIFSPQTAVEVRPLPAGAPASFGGGVGSFRISARISRDSLKMHEAASLVVTISGRGNVSLLEAPKISLPPDFELYDTKINDRTDKGAGGTSGTKSFEFPFIPRSYGDFEIPAVPYAYYDVEAGKYVQLSTAPLRIHVARDKTVGQPAAVSALVSDRVERDGVQNLGEDIRFIVPAAVGPVGRKGENHFLIASAAYWLWAFALAAAAAAFYFLLRKVASVRADVVGARNRGAVRMARQRLKAAREYLEKNLSAAFYEELHKALLGFISDKLNLQVEELSRERISGKLLEGGVPEALAERFILLLDSCEYARYSPDNGHETMNADFEEAVAVISSIGTDRKLGRPSFPAARLAMWPALIPAVSALLLTMSPSVAKAAEPGDSLAQGWARGTEAYYAGDWEQAARIWETLRDATGKEAEAADLYYNAGNARYKSGEIARAILDWERALKLDPSHADARFNLEFANSRIRDRIDPVPEFLLTAFARKVSYLMKPDTWAVLSLLLFALALALLLLYLLSGRKSLRVTGFYGAILLLLFSAGCFGFAKWQYNDYRRADEAIMMRPVSSVKSSPATEASKDLFVLHEGTKVRLLDRVGSWCKIELADGRQGWAPASDMEIIAVPET